MNASSLSATAKANAIALIQAHAPPPQPITGTFTGTNCTLEIDNQIEADYDVPAGYTVGSARYVTLYLSVTDVPTTHTLALTINGSGTVAVQGTTYSASTTLTLPVGTSVALSGSPAAGNTFSGFTGAASGTAATSITMDGDKSVAATFVQTNYSLSLTISSGGTVIAQGVTYDASTSLTFPAGTVVSLSGSAKAQYAFTGFSGDASGEAATSVTMNGHKSVTATFTPIAIENTPPSISWTSTPGSVASGATYTISASASDAEANLDSIVLKKGGATMTTVATVGASGSASTTSSDTGPATVTWTATATDREGATTTITQTVTVSAPPAVTAEISASPTSETAPGATTISWSSSNASSVSVSGTGLSSTAASGSQAVSDLAAGSYTYTITAQGVSGTVTRSVTVTINEPVAIPSVTSWITVSPASTTAPATATVSWGSEHASSVSVSGTEVSSTAASGSQTISGLAAGTYTYTITAEGNGGPVTRTATVTVTAPVVGATISASATNAVAPGTATVTWTSANATSVSVSGPSMTTSTALSGSQSLSGLAAGTYTYTITAQGNGGPVTQTSSFTITSGGPLSASIEASPDRIYDGESSIVSWSSANASTVKVTGAKGFVSTATSGNRSIIASDVGYGSHVYTITAADAVGNVVKQSVALRVVGNGRNMAMRTNPDHLTWQGGTVTFIGDSSMAGPGKIIIMRQVGGKNVYVTSIDIALDGTGGQEWATWDVPGNPSTTAWGGFYVECMGTDQYGGWCASGVSVQPAPTGTPEYAQPISITPPSSNVMAGTYIYPIVVGAKTNVAWTGVTNTWGTVNERTSIWVPANTADGTQYTVAASAPAGVYGGVRYAASNGVTATYTVGKQPPTITWATPATITYGTALSATQLNATASVAGTFVYSPAAGSILPAGTHTLTATFTPTDTARYRDATATVTLTVDPATLTITAANVTRAYGQPNPALTYTMSGFVNGDTAASITRPVASTTADISSPAGTYAITLTGGFATNYALTFVNGTLTVVIAHDVTTFTPVANSYTVNDPSGPLHGHTYKRIWQEGTGWFAYLGRQGVKFQVQAQAYPSVQAVEIEAKAPGGEWKQLAIQIPTGAPAQVDLDFDVMLDSTVPGNPLMPSSYQSGPPLVGTWTFRARVQDATGTWGDYSNEVQVQAVWPIATKTITGQTVPPSGPLGDWFTASPVQDFTSRLWIP